MTRPPEERVRAEPRALCCASACREWIRATRVMCQTHWDLVPRPLRQEIGEAVLGEDPAALAAAKRRAAQHVARRERG